MADQGAAAAVPVQAGLEGIITDEESHGDQPEFREAREADANEDESGESSPPALPDEDEENPNPLEASSNGLLYDPLVPVHQRQPPLLPNEGYPQVPFAPMQYNQPFPPLFHHAPPPHLQPYDPFALQSYDEARRQAAAYAMSAASTAHAMAQIAQAAANFAAGHGPPPSQTAMMPLMPPWNPYSAMYHPLAHPHGHPGMNDYGSNMPEQKTNPSNQQAFARHDAHGRKRHERPPSDNDSASIPKFVHHSSHRDPHKTRNDHRRRRLSNDSPSSSSETTVYNPDGLSSRQRHRKRPPRQHGMASLLGKTAVAALFEWCSKRRCDPPKLELQDCSEDASQVNDHESTAAKPTSSTDCFMCIVFINGEERGRSSSRTKSAARQAAARRAFLSLVPGAVFDNNTGLLVSLPATGGLSSNARQGARNRSASMDEELPNLAKRLAIGRDQETSETDYVGDSKKKRLKSSVQQQPKRTPGLYPASSTTASEEDGESFIFRTTEAGVCSVLLHALFQIAKMPAPVFSYEIKTPLSIALENDVRKRNVPGLSAVGETRAFICRARWCLPKSADATGIGETTPVVDELLDRLCAAAAEGQPLESCGAGVTKREARYIAAADLLALLFPECDSMMEVKAAAEVMRARYAEDKARKRLRFAAHHALTVTTRRQTREEQNMRAMFHRDDPELPRALHQELLSLIDCNQETQWKHDTTGQEEIKTTTLTINSPRPSPHLSSCRSKSRQQQIDLLTEQALHTLNERDEEGRTIPEFTEDDVGRTILRRALSEDYSRIKKLFASDGVVLPRSSDLRHTCAANEDYGTNSQQVWSTPSIILLLCRAIAPHEDPPLGCCVLTFGFSMNHGRVLNIALIASEPHLPRERFVECVSDFASILKCHLEVKLLGSEAIYTSEHAQQIVLSHTTKMAAPLETANNSDDTSALPNNYGKKALLASTLQSVQEESEQSDSSSDKRPKKQTSKPSKRSRFE